MKCFGYDKNNLEELLDLNEVTIQAKPDMLRKLAEFLNECANDIESNPSWEHEHFKDRFSIDDALLDIIVYREE